ncbi:DNA-binding protein, partial [Clostridium perfringens]
MNYTVDQVSKELNISKQAIYKQLKKDEFKEYIMIIDGVKHISTDGLNLLKGENPLEKVIKQQVEEIERLKDDNKRLLYLLEQQNNIILNCQELEKKALNNTELLLLEKREELKKRAEEYNKSN